MSNLGTAKTLNISKGGVLLECNDQLPAGRTIEVSIQWPFLLDGIRPMKLLVYGTTVRTRRGFVAVQSHRHEFRLAGR